MKKDKLPTITISDYTRADRKRLLNVRLRQMQEKGRQTQDIIKILMDEFHLSRAVVYGLIDTRLSA